MTLYRHEIRGLGVYEAVEKLCPRDDPRRARKPDGSWLPKSGPAFPGALSFWTEAGLRRYRESGLEAWHASLLGQPAVLLEVDEADLRVVARDEWQVIARLAPTPQASPVLATGSTREIAELRLDAHVLTLDPGEPAPLPASENLDETFFYVLEGTPTAWVDGTPYALAPGWAGGVPLGSGRRLGLSNPTSHPVRLLVAGRRGKVATRANFESPNSSLAARSPLETKALTHGPSHLRTSPWCYNGSHEIFSRGARLSSALGLRAIGVWHEFLDPSYRSSWPHAHEREQEIALVLRGHPTAWINGHRFELNPGDLAYFPPGTNLSHALMNRSDDVVEYLGLGETELSAGKDRIYYPLQKARNEECRLGGYLWENRPA